MAKLEAIIGAIKGETLVAKDIHFKSKLLAFKHAC